MQFFKLALIGATAAIIGSCASNPSAPKATEDTSQPEVDPTAVIEVVVGHRHACALLKSGDVACWGANKQRQLGDGSEEDSPTPVRVLGIDDAVQLSAGAAHTCALHESGRVSCWGEGQQGQLGDGGTLGDRLRAKEREAQSAGVALAEVAWLGPVWVRGPGASQFCTDAPRLEKVVQVAAAANQTCALHESGDVSCWGALSAVQAWMGNLIIPNRPTDPAFCALPAPGFHDKPAKRLVSGPGYACAIDADDAARCWGDNSQSRLGIAPTRPGFATEASLEDAYIIPGKLESISGVREIATSESHTCALGADGALGCWGGKELTPQKHSHYPELPVPGMLPRMDGLHNLTLVAGRVCALNADGLAHCWGIPEAGKVSATTIPFFAPAPTEQAESDEATTDSRENLEVNKDLENHAVAFKQMALAIQVDDTKYMRAHHHPRELAEQVFGCGITRKQKLVCWGANAFGQLGDGSTEARRLPVEVSLDAAAIIAAKDARERPKFVDADANSTAYRADRCATTRVLGDGPTRIEVRGPERSRIFASDKATFSVEKSFSEAKQLRIDLPDLQVFTSPTQAEPTGWQNAYLLADMPEREGQTLFAELRFDPRPDQSTQRTPVDLGCVEGIIYRYGTLKITRISDLKDEDDAFEGSFQFGPEAPYFASVSGTFRATQALKPKKIDRSANDRVELKDAKQPDFIASTITWQPDEELLTIRLFSPANSPTAPKTLPPGFPNPNSLPYFDPSDPRDDASKNQTTFDLFPREKGEWLVIRDPYDWQPRRQRLDGEITLDRPSNLSLYVIEAFNDAHIKATVWTLRASQLPERFDPKSTSLFKDQPIRVSRKLFEEKGEKTLVLDTEAIQILPGHQVAFKEYPEGVSTPAELEFPAARASESMAFYEGADSPRGAHRRRSIGDKFQAFGPYPDFFGEVSMTPDVVDEEQLMRLDAPWDTSNTSVWVDPETLALRRLEHKDTLYQQGASPVTVTATLTGEELKLRAHNDAQGTHESSRPIEGALFHPTQVFALLPRLDFAHQKHWKFRTLSLHQERVRAKTDAPQALRRYVYTPALYEATLQVLGAETLRLNDAEIDTWRVKLALSALPRDEAVVFWVEKAGEHRVIARLHGSTLWQLAAERPDAPHEVQWHLDAPGVSVPVDGVPKTLPQPTKILGPVIDTLKSDDVTAFAEIASFPVAMEGSCSYLPTKKEFLAKAKAREASRPAKLPQRPARYLHASNLRALDPSKEADARLIEPLRQAIADCPSAPAELKKADAARAPGYVTVDIHDDGRTRTMIVRLSIIDGDWKLTGTAYVR